MTEMQRMLDGSIEPVAPHRDDLIECSDGSVIRREDAEWFDCRGVVHPDEESMNDANDDIVRELLDAEDAWIGEYVETDDYASMYDHCVFEDCVRWRDRIEEWVDANHPELTGDVRKTIIDDLVDKIDDFDVDTHYQRNEYACFHGDGVCLDSYEVGEYETQIDINDRPELKALHESGDLDGCLDRYRGDLCVNENDYYDRESGRRVKCGYASKGDHPHFYGYSGGWGRWHWVVSEERMEELLCEVCVSYCRRTDR